MGFRSYIREGDLQKVDSSTYRTRDGYYVEKMADGTWTAYLPIEDDDRYLWKWSCPKCSTRALAMMSISSHRRLSKRGG